MNAGGFGGGLGIKCRETKSESKRKSCLAHPPIRATLIYVLHLETKDRDSKNPLSRIFVEFNFSNP
jgi:hypothetical protein